MRKRWIAALLLIVPLCFLLLLVVQIAGKRDSLPELETIALSPLERSAVEEVVTIPAEPSPEASTKPPEEIVESPSPPDRERERATLLGAGAGGPAAGGVVRKVYGGRVVDHSTGMPVARASVHATAFRGEEASEVAGIPALATFQTRSDEDGRVWLEPSFEEDPTVRLHLQIIRAGYAPRTAVLSRRGAPFEGWREQEFALRPALAMAIRIEGPDGVPLRHVPLRVQFRNDGFDFLSAPTVEVAGRPPTGWNGRWPGSGRLVRPLREEIVFTDSAGRFRVPWSPYQVDLELLDGHHYLTVVDPDTNEELQGRVRTHLTDRSIQARAGIPATQQVVDLDGDPVNQTEIEIALEEMPPLRLRTDAEGRFSLGVMPAPTLTVPVSLVNPRHGTLSVLAPAFANRSVPIALPSAIATVTLPWRPAGVLGFRCVTVNERGDLSPLAPFGLSVSADMTVTRQTTGGEVSLSGALPPPGTLIEIHLRGFLPHVLELPAVTGGEVLLGDLRFEPGWHRDFVVTGSPPQRGLQLLVTQDQQAPGTLTRKQAYPVDANGRVTVSGLQRGSYTASVEGPGVEWVSVAFEVTREQDTEAIEVPISLSPEERVLVSGIVPTLRPGHLRDAVRVVERYRVTWQEDWLTFPAYGVGGSQRFGSTRLLDGVTGVHVVVFDYKGFAADTFVERGLGEPPIFDCGELTPRPRPHTEVSFFVRGLGRVLPPLRAAIRTSDGLEELVRLGVGDGNLIIHNRPVGPLQLDWMSQEDARESVTLQNDGRSLAVTRFEVERPPLAEELVEIRVSDSLGSPLDNARIVPSVAGTSWAYSNTEPGVHLAQVSTRRETQFTVTSPGLLPATVTAAAGSIVPTDVRLYRAVPVHGTLLDADGTLVNGEVLVEWEQRKPSAIRHGEPIVVRVEHGNLETTLPTLPCVYTFRLLDSPAAAVVEMAVAPTRDGFPLGTLRLGESRNIRGRVFLPDGSPALRAHVGLLDRSVAYRFPLTETVALQEARHSTVTDSEGHFTLEGLPQDLGTDLALVARLDGFGDAVQDPLDAELEAHRLVLLHSASLGIEVGYENGIARDDYRFGLEFQRDATDPATRVDLGEIRPHLYGVQRFHSIEPGLYRVRWGLREAYEPIPGLWEEILVEPGIETQLDLQLEGRVLTGTARLNGQPLAKGWFLLTTDPSASTSTRVGRVLDGTYYLVDPPQTFRGYGALIPETTPLAQQNVPRGEALPQVIPQYSGAVRRGRLHLSYEAHRLTLQFTEGFFADHPGANLSFRSYDWDGHRFRATTSQEPIDEPTVHFHLLPPGVHRFTVRSGKGSLLKNLVVDLHEDLVIHVR